MILKIATYPNKILETPCEEVGFPVPDAVRQLIKNMLETVRDANGIGLAAPQVNKNLRIIVVNLEYAGIPAFALINPKVAWSSKKTTEMEEGCLSIPGVFGMVERPEKITFSGQDINGKIITARCGGILSKVVQHEIDHTNGILILEKIKKYTQGKELLKK